MTKSLTYVEVDVPDLRTIVHLSFDGQNDSNQVIDNNPAGYLHTWSAVASIFLQFGDAPFGAAQLLDSGGGAISTPDSAEFDLGSANFNIEVYFRKNVATGTERNIAGQRAGVGGANTTRAWNIDIDTAGHVRGLVFQGSTQVACTGTTVFGSSATWHHISFNRSGSLLLLFVDGVLEASTAITGAINNSSGFIAIGQDGEDTSGRWSGFLDEFTMALFARRTVAFTPEDPNVAGGSNPALLPVLKTYRFAQDAGYLPMDIDAIPSIKQVQIDPASISLGENLGQRATVTVTFRDHRHVFTSEAFYSGTFWGKFRAYYGLRLQQFPFRVVVGSLGQSLGAMETRHYAIESATGPSATGEFKIVAKDILKFADGDRALAPVPSQGFLTADIAAFAASATLSPAGIGNIDYPTSGQVAIGGTEILTFTRSGDVLTFTDWGDNGTEAVDHNAQDRVQLVLTYFAESPADIIYDLLANYAQVPRQYMDLTAWQNEINTFLNTVYTAVIAEPTAVADLISELIEQVGLIFWWDDIAEQIRFQVLKTISSTAEVYDQDLYLTETLQITEQPDKRLSRVYTYFAKINPLKPNDQADNYRSSAFSIDEEAESAYGTPLIKTIYSRWIPDGGRAVATSINEVQLARYRDPPRRISFSLLRGSTVTPSVGVGYLIGGWPFQETDGSAAMVGAQITRLNPRADIFEVEVEEISGSAVPSVGSPGVHEIIIDASQFDVELRDMHDSIYGTPISGNEVRCTINAGVIVGASSISVAAFYVGDWPVGVSVKLTVNGRIQGHGGIGGSGSGSVSANGSIGQIGGTALYTRKAITLVSASGQIWGGGGGGGGGGSSGTQPPGIPQAGGSGGGGGAGTSQGSGGAGGFGAISGNAGASGSATAGGAGGTIGGSGSGTGGAGGGPGLAGSAGSIGAGVIHTNGGAGGATGNAIDGISFVTTIGGSGDRRGGTIN